jgi:hypothetical protein
VEPRERGLPVCPPFSAAPENTARATSETFGNSGEQELEEGVMRRRRDTGGEGQHHEQRLTRT